MTVKKEDMKSVDDVAREILMFIQNLETADDAYEFVRLYLLSLAEAGWAGSVGAVYASIAEVDERFDEIQPEPRRVNRGKGDYHDHSGKDSTTTGL